MTDKSPDLGDYYTTEQAAKILGVSTARVGQLIGWKFQGKKMGNKVWIVEKESLDKYAEAVKIARGK